MDAGEREKAGQKLYEAEHGPGKFWSRNFIPWRELALGEKEAWSQIAAGEIVFPLAPALEWCLETLADVHEGDGDTLGVTGRAARLLAQRSQQARLKQEFSVVKDR